ncbi:MAG TPA: cytochrome ubiquinol oxidase subunit I, partial [Dokdonella sp.]|nr:cytochrome ubiquinol oxidase subunit I [Dokdonella sp.]
MHFLLGNLDYAALPLYSPVAAIGAAVEMVGTLGIILAITWFGKWKYLWNEWLTSLDHKRIGIMYVALALIMLSRGVIEGVMM